MALRKKNETTDKTTKPPLEEMEAVRIFDALRQIIRITDIDSRRLVSEFQITAPQLHCLRAVDKMGAPIGSEIAADVHLSPSTVVGILDRLEAKGLIIRERSTKDRRRVSVSATEAGHRLAEDAPSSLLYTLSAALEGLPKTRKASIAHSLEELSQLISKIISRL